MRRLLLALVLALVPGVAPAQINVTPPAGGGGASGTTPTDVTAAWSFLDNANFTLKNTTDPTKLMRFNGDGITAGQTRVLAWPNVSSTIAVLGLEQTFTTPQNFTGAVTQSSSTWLGTAVAFTNPHFRQGTQQTPDTFILGTSTTSNHIVMVEGQDVTFDFAHAATTSPTLFGHSENQSTTQWWGLKHDATNGVLSTGLGALRIASASGMILSTGSAPTVSACGTTPSTVTGSNTAGRLTTGSGGTVQSCTITFVPALAAAPSCVATNETAIILLRATATTTTLVIDAAVAGTMESDVLSFLCLGGV